MKRKYAALALALSASMALSPAASVSAAATEIGTPPVLSSSQDADTSAPVAQFSVNGTLQNIENEGHYNFLPGLKFHDDTKLESYILNGKENPTSIKGNTWGDGNYGNIKNYLHVGNGDEGKNELTVTDQAGNSSTYMFYLDKTSPILTEDSIQISPDNSTMAPKKEVTLTVDEAIQSPGEGWVEENGSNGMVWKKTFTSNYKDNSFTVTDLAGNPSKDIFFEVKRIESRAPEATVAYSNGDAWTNQDVTVTLTANIECATPDGWNRVNGSKKQFAKVFKENATEEITLISTAGVSAEKPITVTVDKIDKDAPTAEISYSPSNDWMSTEKTVTISADEPVTPNTDGWTEVEGSDGKQWQKVYTKAQKDTVTVTDRAGNTSTYEYEVKRIESEALSADISYSNNGEATNQDVTVTIKTNLECKVPEGWEAVPGSAKRNAFQKVFTENTAETVTLTSLGGQTTTKDIQVTGIDKEAPDVTVDVENKDEMTYHKTVTLTGNEPFKVVKGEMDKLLFTPKNDEDGDGYATVWISTALQNVWQGYTVEDKLGNSDVVAVFVDKVDSVKPVPTITFTTTEPTTGDVTAQIVWNTYPSKELEEQLLADGWKKTYDIPATFVRTFKQNERLEYTNVESHTGIPGDPFVVEVTNIDREGPVVSVEVEKPDVPTPTKTVTLTCDEPFKITSNPSGKLNFSAQNDDDGDGYATVWKASAGTTIFESYGVEDKLGNTSTVGVLVTNADSLVPSASVKYVYTEPTLGDVPVVMTWNVLPSQEVIDRLQKDGWTRTYEVPVTFTKVFKANETVVYRNIKSYTGVPGEDITVSVTNIQQEVVANFYDEENNRQAAEITISVPKDNEKTTVDAALVLDKMPQDYVYAGTDTEFQINDGYIYVPVKLTKETKEISINFWDNVLNEQACTSTMNVPYYAETVNPADIPLPQGYEFVGSADTPITINDGWIWADVKKSDVTVGINYWDIENNTQVTEGKIAVSGYDTTVNTSKLQIPEGYELVNAGDLTITGGWLWVELRPVEKPQEMKDAVLKIHFVDEFGNPIEGVEPIILAKNGIVGEYAHFLYDTDWTLPEGYIFASDNDESIAKQDIAVKYGETVDTLEIAIEKGADAVLIITLTDEWGNPLEEITLTHTGKAGTYTHFLYGTDWTLPEGYEFASFNDEQIATQDIMIKYGETLDTLQIAVLEV